MAIAERGYISVAQGFYLPRIDRFGLSPEAVGWPTREKQEIRFNVLCDIAPLDGRSILDVGCGFGDLKGYLDKRYKGVEYEGIDICREFVDVARQAHSKSRFRTLDLLQDELPDRYDYVLASGLLGLNVGNNAEFREAMLLKMWDACRLGMAVNMVSTFVDYEEEYLAYSDPRELFAFCMTNLTHKVSLRHDYLSNDFTVHLYR